MLSRVTVTRTAENSPKSFMEPLVVSGPPFVVESTTDVPFLARVTLDWNGEKNAQTVVEHWVQVSHVGLASGSRLTHSSDRSPENRLHNFRPRTAPRHRT